MLVVSVQIQLHCMNEQLEQKRQAIVQQIQSIERLRRGSLSEQTFRRNKESQILTFGPYYVLQGFRKGQKFSERIPAAKAPRVSEDVQNYQRFQHLAEQFVEVTDELTRSQSSEGDAKKNSRSPKSRTKSSRKPRPS
jgi:hypothetical protein